MGIAISHVLASLEFGGAHFKLTDSNISSNQYPEGIVFVKSQILNQYIVKHNRVLSWL